MFNRDDLAGDELSAACPDECVVATGHAAGPGAIFMIGQQDRAVIFSLGSQPLNRQPRNAPRLHWLDNSIEQILCRPGQIGCRSLEPGNQAGPDYPAAKLMPGGQY